MNKAKAGKLLSAAAVANMAAVAFAASPASASAHPAAGTAGGAAATAVPSAGRPHPGVIFIPPGKAGTVAELSSGQLRQASPTLRAAAKAAATAAKPRGFVPRASPGVRPDTETGCGGHICWGLHGGANFVSYVDEHFFTWTGCHIAHFDWVSPGGASSVYTPPGYFCSKQDAKWTLNRSFPTGTAFCGDFNNVPGGNTSVPGIWCETVR
jgi:hypothetical protein